MADTINVADLVPGGIQPDDHVHNGSHDNSCSRCRWTVAAGDVGLKLESPESGDLLIYCVTCLPLTTKGQAGR